MKRSLTEELKRIHTLTYGQEVLNEEGFLDKLLKKIGFKDDEDDPEKAKKVTGDVNDFFKTLENASKSGGLSQQKSDSMSYQKEVESMQIGLLLLGYELPIYGVDGLFGPETMRAVSKFKSDNKILSESIEFVDGKGIIGRPGQGTHRASDWQSSNAWDVKTEPNAEVKSLTNGVVKKVYKSGSSIKKVGNKKIFGDQVTIKSSSGPDVFYTHITSSVSPGDNVSVGDVIGKVMLIPGMPPHVHVGLSSGNLSDLASNLSNATGGKTSNQTNSDATPEMLNKLINLLKQRGIKSNQIKQYIEIEKVESGGQFTDLDLSTREGINKYTEIAQKFIDTRPNNLLNITGEMLTRGAILALQKYNKYIPPELPLAQLATEGGFTDNPNARPIKTKNPFNVGNVDTGENRQLASVQDGINAYYELIARDYLGDGKTANDLINNFVNKSGYRYASASNYEQVLNKISSHVNKISQQVMGGQK